MAYSCVNFPLNSTSITFEENGIVGKRTILPSGIRVLSETVPGQQSVSLGFWVGAGSRDEQHGAEGSTHFLEHLLFKGTSNRSSLDISRESDFLGGTINAATSRTYTSYYGRVFAGDLPQLVDLLADMITNSLLDRSLMDVERGVILEELAASEDDVSEVAETALLPLVMGQHPLARPVGATMDEVRVLDHEHMISHYRQVYIPSEIVVCAAGDVKHDILCELIEGALGKYGWEMTPSSRVVPTPRRHVHEVVYTSGSERFIEHPGRQSAVVLGMPGLGEGDPDLDAFFAMNAILGGGTSSRLFQEVREKRGLAYSAYSWLMKWNEGGVFGLEAACAPENTDTVRDVMFACLDELAANGVTDQELDTAYNQARAQLTFAAETNSFRQNRLGGAEVVRGELRSIEETLRAAQDVTTQDVQRVAARLASGARSAVIAGPKK